MTLDTRALHLESCRNFNSISAEYIEGKKILEEITDISHCLDKLGELKDLRIVSSNDSTWHPSITTGRLKQLVRIDLEKTRDELREKFNRMFKQEKP